MNIIKQLLVATCALVMLANLKAMETPPPVVDATETVEKLWDAIKDSQVATVQDILSQNPQLQLPPDILVILTSDSEENQQILKLLLNHEKTLSPNTPSHLINHVRPKNSKDWYAGMSIIHYFTDKNLFELVSILVAQYNADPNVKVNYKGSDYYLKSPIVIATDNFLTEAVEPPNQEILARCSSMLTFLSKHVTLDATDLQLINARYQHAPLNNISPTNLQHQFLQPFAAPHNNQNPYPDGTIAAIVTHPNSYYFLGGGCIAAFLGYVIYKYYSKPKPRKSVHQKAKAGYEAVKPL